MSTDVESFLLSSWTGESGGGGGNEYSRFNTCIPGITKRPNGTYQDHARVHQRERPRASDPGAAVHDGGAVVLPQPPRLLHFKQEVEERRRGLRDPEVGPGGVMKVVDLSLLSRLRRAEEREEIDIKVSVSFLGRAILRSHRADAEHDVSF